MLQTFDFTKEMKTEYVGEQGSSSRLKVSGPRDPQRSNQGSANQVLAEGLMSHAFLGECVGVEEFN